MKTRRSLMFGTHSMRRKKAEKGDRRYEDFVVKRKEMEEAFSTDVAALREEIDIASIELREAQEKFDKCEKAYVDAKTDLFIKKEKKDLLTTCLFGYIRRNELEKAKTLSGFVERLELIASPLKKPVNPTDDAEPDEKEKQPDLKNSVHSTAIPDDKRGIMESNDEKNDAAPKT